MSECGCHIQFYYAHETSAHGVSLIRYCPLHTAAFEMREMIGALLRVHCAQLCDDLPGDDHYALCSDAEKLLAKTKSPLTDPGKTV